MKWTNWKLLVMSAIIAMVAAGCSSDKEPAQPEEKETAPPDPITLKYYNGVPAEMSESQYRQWVEEPIRSQYPHITLEYIEGGTSDITAAVAIGNIPDLVYFGLGSMPVIRQLELVDDLTPLLKTLDFDESRLEDGLLDTLRSFSGTGIVPALPITANSMTLYYNKGIFDQFGVPYPTDGMTYDQVFELAKRVTRREDGVQYKGLNYHLASMIQYNQLGISFVDPATDKVLVNSNSWKVLMDNLTRFSSEITGNLVRADINQERDRFFTTRNIAMVVAPNLAAHFTPEKTEGLDWDMVTVPTYKENPGVGAMPFFEYVAVSRQSAHRLAALEAITHLVSDEVQTMISRAGKGTVLKNQDIKNQMGQDVEAMRGKNTAAFAKYPYATPRTATIYDAGILTIMIQQFRLLYDGNIDVNTAMRNAEEAAINHIAAEKAK